MDENKLYEQAVMLWGKQAQSDMMIEEASELIKVILKYRRGQASKDDVASEIVDCHIMLSQMHIILNDENKFKEQLSFKLNRLQSRIEKELRTDLGKMKRHVHEEAIKKNSVM